MHGALDTFDNFVDNIKLAGVDGVVNPIRSTSHEACARFSKQSVHVLFIDGSHEYSDVKRDIEDWTPTLTRGAIVAFNDPLFPGVYRALRELVLTNGSQFRSLAYVANTLFFVFQSREPWRLGDSLSLRWQCTLLALRRRAQVPAGHMPAWMLDLGRLIYQRLQF
jgi:hypothetical protein